MLEAVARIEARSESVVIVGDLNRAVGDIVPGNAPKVSYGGKLIKSR